MHDDEAVSSEQSDTRECAVDELTLRPRVVRGLRSAALAGLILGAGLVTATATANGTSPCSTLGG